MTNYAKFWIVLAFSAFIGLLAIGIVQAGPYAIHVAEIAIFSVMMFSFLYGLLLLQQPNQESS
ncbi:hypothetical protein B0H94_10821 [Salsuginibacillus halophilus]|uniref:Uncharacterized protein n=1 Tax=Salsuginibacillus halophilus TaxID=517424 RepID=A0A2P8HE23_9BACI|nr:hypothetical protein [Salsuginibacillus halophilus]PSL44411.1 hypothetical protein B0H94_10821 [Salsuginibacillus halophilus]